MSVLFLSVLTTDEQSGSNEWKTGTAYILNWKHLFLVPGIPHKGHGIHDIHINFMNQFYSSNPIFETPHESFPRRSILTSPTREGGLTRAIATGIAFPAQVSYILKVMSGKSRCRLP